MNLLDRIASEHVLIGKVTEALDRFADGGGHDVHEVIRFVTFFRGYADGLHHEREENVLLPALAKTGFPASPLAFIREQHRDEAKHLLRFEMATSARAPWGTPERRAIVEAAHAFTSFVRDHMARERDLLMPVAAKELANHAASVQKAEDLFELRSLRWNIGWLEGLGDELIQSHAR